MTGDERTQLIASGIEALRASAKWPTIW